MWRALIPLACILIISFVNNGEAGLNPSICLTGVPQPQAKPFPIIPNSFRAAFTWNMAVVNTSYFIEEVFSEDLQLGVMVIDGLIAPAITSKLYTYAHTGEFIYVPYYDGSYGANCTVGNLTSNDFAFPFKRVNGNDLLVSGKDVLFFGANSAIMSYRGTGLIDDIDVDIWNGCLYNQGQDLTMNATYYFTLNTTNPDKKWSTASGMDTTIKRIHVIQDNSAGTSPAESTYEYAYFTDNIPQGAPSQLRLYEPPLGAYCEGRKQNKPVPGVPDYFTFFMEVHDPQQNLITYTDEWYDFTANLSRMDHNILQDRSNVSEPVKIIHDYKTGLSYNIAKYTGECVITPILPDSFDNVPIPGAQNEVRMRNPKEFFDFDNPKYTWIYEGTFMDRGVDCEVWISKRPYPTEDSNIMAYWEWYFTNSQWVISNGDVRENMEPFKMVITVPELNHQKTEFYIYKFNEEPPSERYWDISECFDQHNESRSYELILKADIDKYQLDQNVGMMEYWTMAALEAFSGVRALRVNHVEFIFDKEKKRIFVRFTMLGAPTVKGDVAHPEDQLTLDQAEMYLTKSLKNNQFVVYYLQANGKETQFQAISTSLARMEYTRDKGKSVFYVIDDDGIDGQTLPPKTVPRAVKPGGAAALAIVLLIIGVVLVAVPFYFLSIRNNQSMESFRKSQLTMSDMQD